MKRTRRILPIILVLVALCAGYYVWHSGRSARQPVLTGPVLRVVFLDAATGGGAFVRTPDGEFSVIDPGPASAGRNLARHLEDERVQVVTVVVTNPSPNRSGGLKTLLESFKVKRIIRGEMDSQSAEWTDAVKDARTRGIPELVLSAGDGVGLSHQVRLDVLSPPRGLVPGLEPGSPSNSLVARIKYGGNKILFASDAGTEAESWLIASEAVLASDVLSVGQRGKSGASSLELISFVRPRVFVVSAGGRFGQPSRAVLSRIAAEHTGANVYRTDRDGAVEVATNGRTIAVETERGDRE